MKRFALLLALLLLLPSLALGEFLVTEDEDADSEILLDDQEYLKALAQLSAGSLVDAVNSFGRLGERGDAVRCAAYAKARLDYERGYLSAALEGFTELAGFRDSAEYAEACKALGYHRCFENGKFGYIDASGAWRIQPAYDWAERAFATADGSASSAVARVFIGETACDGKDLLPVRGKYGLVRSDGALLTPIEYDEISWVSGGLAAARDARGVTVYSLALGRAIGGPYDEVGAYGEGFVPVRQGDTWGYLGADGGALTGGWRSALPFSGGLAGVTDANGLAGFINPSGAYVIQPQYQAVASFGDGLAGFQQKKKWGFLYPSGEVAIKPKYQAVDVFSQGRCAVRSGGKWGVIDVNGAWIVKNRYDEITAYDPIYHRAWMRNNKLWGILSLDGEVVRKPSWATFDGFGAEGMSRVSYVGEYGYTDTMGVMRIPNAYAWAAPFTSGCGGVEDKGEARYLDKLGHGFTLDSDVPTECLWGFLEGRKITEHTVVTLGEDGTESSQTTYTIEFAVYDAEGARIK